MSLALLFFVVTLVRSSSVTDDNSRSSPDHVDPWDVVTDFDFSSSRVALESNLSIVDKALRLAQKDMKYFLEEKKPWEEDDLGEDQIMGSNLPVINKTQYPPLKGFGDKQTADLMKDSMVPEFDITKLKLKPDKKNNESVFFSVGLKPGPENKIIGYSSRRLHVQIHAPQYPGAAENELARFLSKVLCVPRNLVKVRQGAGQNIRKVRIPKSAIQEKVYIRKLLKEFELDKVTEKIFNA